MIGGDFGGTRVGKRKKKAAAANGNGVQEKVTYQFYTVFNQEFCHFICPRFLGDVRTRHKQLFS